MKIINVLLVLCMFISCKNFDESSVDSVIQDVPVSRIEIISENFDFKPTSTTGVVYTRDGFAFSYSEAHEQSEWVAYSLDASDFNYSNYVRPYFVQDPIVETNSADWRNYKNSGYDKGHLCPAGDRKANFKTYKETFYTSNISPQRHDFNSGLWNRLEEKTRYWAEKYNGIYVMTGGVLTNNLKTIGKEEVSVPDYFYKILLTKDGTKMIGFLVPHKESNKPLYEFVTSVDAIEKMTGIDFFPNLEDAVESELEKSTDYKKWSF